MIFFIGLVLALVCAMLIYKFITKFWKPFWTRFIPRFFTRFIPKFCKVMMWITLVVGVLFIGITIVDITYHYTKDYICRRDILAGEHMLPSDFVPQLREYGVKKVWRRWYEERGVSYEELEAQAKEQEAIAKKEKEALAKKKFLRDPGPFPDTFWWRVPNYLFMKYGKWKYGEYFGEF